MKKAVLIVAAFIGIACWILSAESEQKQAEPQRKSPQFSEHDRSDQKAPPPAVVTHQSLINAIERAIAASADKAQTQHDPQPPDTSTLRIQVALAIFTGALVIVGALQVWIIFRTLKATQTAAEAAKQSANGLQKIERAYFAVDYFSMDEEFQIGKSPMVQCRVINSGRTPGTMKEVFTSLILLKKSQRPFSIRFEQITKPILGLEPTKLWLSGRSKIFLR